jgi:hypothetical protein
MRLGELVNAALCVMVAGASLPTRAADASPPTISHAPPASCPLSVAGVAPMPCLIEATIVDDSGVFDPTLLVRLRGVQAYDRVPMKPIADRPNVYGATVPAALLAAGGVEYLIEAFDVQGNGPARAGEERAPLLLIPTAPAPAPAPVDTNTGLVLGVAVGVGVAVLIGVGVGVAVYALRPPALDQVSVIVSAPSPVAAVSP